MVNLYFDEVEAIEKEYCTAEKIGDNDALPKNWMTQTSSEQKTRIKMKLMERTMAWVHLYRKMEAEMKRCYPLWRQNIVSGRYWSSIKNAETRLEREFADIKKEVFLVGDSSS